MKSFIYFYILFLVFYGCNRTKYKGSTIEFSEDHPMYYYRLSKIRDCTLNKRINNINKAYLLAKYQNKDSVALISLSLKALLHKKNKEPDSVIIYAKKMLSLASKLKDSFKIGRANFKIAEYYRSNNLNDSAYYYLNESKEIFMVLNDSIQVGKKLNTMGRILLDDNDHYLGETTLIEALQYLEPKKDTSTIVKVFHNLSYASRKQYNYDKALEYINKALLLNKSNKNKVVLQNSKLLTLRKSKNYEEVISHYSTLLNIVSIAGSKKEYARILDNLAYTEWLFNKSLEAEKKLLRAYNIRKSLNDFTGLIASNSHLMKYYVEKDKQKAIGYANNLYDLTIKQNNIEDRLEALTYLRNLTPKKYIKYSELYIGLKDSLSKAREIAGNKYAAIRYNSRKDKEKAQILEIINKKKELTIQKQKTKSIIYAGIGIFTILSSIYLFFYLRTRHRKEKILERHSTEKRLSKKLHDEVGNDVFYLMSQLQNENESIKSSNGVNIIDGLDAVYHKVRDFSRDHTIETGVEYGDELLSLLNSYGNQEIKIFTKKLDDDFWITISEHKKVALYWALKELLTNMKKHSEATIVSVSIAKEKKNIVVKYTDNGIGMNMNDPQKRKNGLRNVENRIEEIKGTITFDTKPQEGFKASIAFAP